MAERKMPVVEDYPSASIASEHKKEEEKDIIRVRRRKSVLKEIKGEFRGEDAPTVESYMSYILYDILLPTLRDLISDIGHGAIDMAMGTDGRRYRGRRDNRTYISYDRYWDRESPRRRARWADDDDDDDYRDRRRRKRGVPTNEDLDDFIFRTKDDAKEMLRKLRNRIDRYGDVSVAWYLDQMGETLAGDFTNEDWGWYNLDEDRVELKPAYGGGWRIIFPKIRPIN